MQVSIRCTAPPSDTASGVSTGRASRPQPRRRPVEGRLGCASWHGVPPGRRREAVMAEQVLEQTCNEVTLVGRVAREPEEKELPSGDLLVLFSVVVDRPPSRRPVPEGSRAVTTDTIDCVAWSAGARRTVGGLTPDDVVRVEGALQRRFWRTERGVTSKCEVEVVAVKRLQRAQTSR